MDKIRWCLKSKNGIELVEPNDNLCQAYLKKAEEALESMAEVSNRDWKISTAYYSMYFSLYSVMMKAGVKCEIHSCTLEFMKQFLSEYYTGDECRLIQTAYKSRVDAQYYVSKLVSDDTYEEISYCVPGFLVKCKATGKKLDEKKIEEIRAKIKKLM